MAKVSNSSEVLKAQNRTGQLEFILATALLTPLTLAGGLALGLVTANLLFESINVHVSGLVSGLVALPVLLAMLFGGGAVWGYAIARLVDGEAKKSARTGALTYGGAVILVGIVLELLFGLISVVGRDIRLPIHVAFTMVFVPAAGIVAALCTRSLAGALGWDDIKGTLGTFSGLAASVGFLAVNMIMLSLGWQVGGPGAAERFTMITVMLTSNAGAALAGGAAMGWVLSRG
jgi:hypothetical protein